MRVAVISPHLDDAVFSVAEHMLSRPDWEFTIVCPCAGEGNDATYIGKYQRLLREHRDVLMATGWEAANGPFLDDVAGPSNLFGIDDWLASALKGGGGRDRFDEWWVPVGIHHPDHLAVRAACGRIGRPTARISFYEELPYRVLYPGSRNQAFMKLAGYDPSMLERKRQLCRMYVSQIGPEVERCLYVPERLWRAA